MSREAGDGTSQPPAQRRRLAEGNFGDPDVILTSKEGTEYPAHSKYLQTACEVFDDLFQLAKNDAAEGNLPSIPLHETSAIIELVLPLVYRKSAASLRDQPFDILVSCIKLAHRLGMPLVVDHISIFLESHVKREAAILYPLACQLDLAELEKRSVEAFRLTIDLSKPFELADLVGTERARRFFKEALSAHRTRFEDLKKSHKAIAKLEGENPECQSEKCPGALCSHPEFILKLQAAAILIRYTDLLKRLGMESGTEQAVLDSYRKQAFDDMKDYVRFGEHHFSCSAHQHINMIYGRFWIYSSPSPSPSPVLEPIPAPSSPSFLFLDDFM